MPPCISISIIWEKSTNRGGYKSLWKVANLNDDSALYRGCSTPNEKILPNSELRTAWSLWDNFWHYFHTPHVFDNRVYECAFFPTPYGDDLFSEVDIAKMVHRELLPRRRQMHEGMAESEKALSTDEERRPALERAQEPLRVGDLLKEPVAVQDGVASRAAHEHDALEPPNGLAVERLLRRRQHQVHGLGQRWQRRSGPQQRQLAEEGGARHRRHRVRSGRIGSEPL